MDANPPEDPLAQRLEAQLARKREFLARQAAKSFLLDPARLPEDSGLKAFLVEARKDQVIERRRHEEPFFSAWRAKYFISRNANLVAHLLIELNAVVLSQPWFTLKTRLQAKSVAGDFSHYVKNNVEKRPLLAGLSHSYALCLLHFSLFVNAQRLIAIAPATADFSVERRNYLAFLATDFLTLPARNALEIRRALIQMGNASPSFKETVFKMRQSWAPMLLRDVIFRTAIFGVLPQEDWRKHNTYRLIDMANALIVGALLSNPLDVICTKIYTQKVEKYSGVLGAARAVRREEGLGKFATGFSMRLGGMAMTAALHYFLFRRLRDGVAESLGKDALLG